MAPLRSSRKWAFSHPRAGSGPVPEAGKPLPVVVRDVGGSLDDRMNADHHPGAVQPSAWANLNKRANTQMPDQSFLKRFAKCTLSHVRRPPLR